MCLPSSAPAVPSPLGEGSASLYDNASFAADNFMQKILMIGYYPVQGNVQHVYYF